MILKITQEKSLKQILHILNKMKFIIPFLILLSYLLSSCSSMNSFQSPNVLLKGEHEVGVGTSFIGDYEDPPALVNMEFFTRLGLNKNFDAGLKVFGLPGLSGGLMADLKYQIINDPIYVSADLGGSFCYTIDLHFYDVYPMLICGSERYYGGYLGIYRNGVDDDAKVEFSNYMNGFFLGCKLGPKPYLRPEINYYYHKFNVGLIIFGLGLQF